MNESRSLSSNFPMKRRAIIRSSSEQMVSIEPLNGSGALPMLIRPRYKGIDAVRWASSCKDMLNELLYTHGGLLFRGFEINSPVLFREFAVAVSRELMTYQERSSPRTQVENQVYTSTDYTADQFIFPHNEHSYAARFPLKIFFFCMQPAEAGGETPIVDCRRVLNRIPPELRSRFEEHGWKYVRNFGSHFGLPWQVVFQTDDPAAVERYCGECDIRCEWLEGGRLRTTQIRPCTARHPVTNELSWFNHATFFNLGSLPAPIQEALRREIATDDLPNNTFFGDGSDIDVDSLRHLHAAYLEDLVTFQWQQGDVLILDNMLTAHARNPFSGERRILVSMADPVSRNELGTERIG